MKTLKMICTSAILALALSSPISAGELNSPGVICGDDIAPVTQPAPLPGSPDPGDISTPGLTVILLTLAAVF